MEAFLHQLANKSLYVIIIAVILGAGIWFNQSEWAFFRRLRRELRAYRAALAGGGTPAADTAFSRVVHQYRALRARPGARTNVAAFVDAVTLEQRIPLLIFPVRFTIPGIERGVRTCSSITIAIGLIGTFLGLTVSLIDLKGSLAALEAANDISTRTVLEGIVAKLKEPLEGMSFAFLTSVSGVFSSALLTGLISWMSGPGQREAYGAELEAFLENEFPADEGPVDSLAVMRALLASFQGLERSLEGGLSASARAIESLASVLGPAAAAFETNSHRMTDAATRMEGASSRLDSTSSRLVSGLDRMDATLERVAGSLGSLEGGMNDIGQDNRLIAGTLLEIQARLFQSSEALAAQVGGLKGSGELLAAAAAQLAREKSDLGTQLVHLQQQGAGVSHALRDFQVAIERFGASSDKLQGDLGKFMSGYESRVESVLGRQFADLHLSLETLRRVLEQSGAESVDRLELILETVRDNLLRAEQLATAGHGERSSRGEAV